MAMTRVKISARFLPGRLIPGRLLSAVAGAALIAGCSTVDGGTATPRGISVTRTHLGGVAGRGEVAVEPRFAIQAAGGLYQPAFAQAVASELRTIGFAPATNPAASEYVATVDVATGTQSALYARIPGTATATAAPTVPGTQLAVQLKRRSDGSIVWEGRAVSGARAASAATVQRLARAMFRDFPGETGRTVTID